MHEQLVVENKKEILNKKDTNQIVSRDHQKNSVSEEYAYLMGDIQLLKKTSLAKENPEEYREKCFTTIHEIEAFFNNLGASEYCEVTNLYNEYKNEHDILAIRKENPEKVISLAAGQEQKIFFDPEVVGDRGDKYANCAIWPHGHSQVAGISTAFLEGRHIAGPIAMVMAVRPHKDHLQIEIPEDALLEVGDIKREAVRIMSGLVKPEDLEFVIVRTQRAFYPQELLTDAEKKSQDSQIFRAYNFRT